MVLFKEKKPTILYLHGYKSNPGDSIDTFLRRYFNIKCPLINHLDPKGSLKNILPLTENVDVVVGLSMGGFYGSLIPHPKKVFINPAFLFPYILLKKTENSKLFGEYMELVGRNQFLNKTKNATLIYWKNDKTEPLSLFEQFYGGKVINSLKGHVPSEAELKDIIIPEIYDII